MALVAEGKTSKQIARVLGISPSTVDNHVRTVVVVLGVASRHEAARLVTEWLARIDAAEDHVTFDLDQAVSSTPGSAAAPMSFTRLPPIGGKPNQSTISQRFVHVAQVALLGTMLFAAITATIAGLVSLLAR